MKKYKIKVSEMSYYEIIVEANSKDEAGDKVADFEIDYTKGRDCSSDPEFNHLEKFWIESVEEIK